MRICLPSIKLIQKILGTIIGKNQKIKFYPTKKGINYGNRYLGKVFMKLEK